QSSGYIPANTPWQFCMARYTIDEGAQLHWAIGAWVADSDGEFKHQVLDNYFTTTSEWPLVADVSGIAASTQFLAQALPLGDTPIEPGDRLVVELGYRALNTTSTPKYGAIVYGGSGGEDLEHGDSGEDVLEKPSWIDVPVSDGLTFSDPVQTAPASIRDTSSGIYTSNQTGHSIDLPEDTQPGDGILVFFASDEADGENLASAPSPWELLDTREQGTSTNVRLSVFWLPQTTGFDSLTITTDAAAESAYICYAIQSPGEPAVLMDDG